MQKKNMISLRERLPFDYAKKAQVLLKRKRKHVYSISMIGYVARERQENVDIMEVLLEIAEKHEKRKHFVMKRMAKPRRIPVAKLKYKSK